MSLAAKDAASASTRNMKSRGWRSRTTRGFAWLYAAPILVNAGIYNASPQPDFWTADRSSAGLLPAATQDAPAIVRIYAARTVRWRGIFAVHTWLVVKDAGGAYERYDVTAFGRDPLVRDRFEADARWFGKTPETVFAADGEDAEKLIAPIKAAIEAYPHRKFGDYVVWPGPNSNTFVAHVMGAAGIGAALPSLAIGKDFPSDGRWVGLTPSRTGARVTLNGLAAVTIGWYEGVEVNVLGGVAGIDIRRPAIKLPALGRFGVAAWP